MSWSVFAQGRAHLVAAEVATQLARITCEEPEQTIKTQIGETIALSLARYHAHDYVKVSASGSQYDAHWNDPAKGRHATNTVKLEIEPLFGFLDYLDKSKDTVGSKAKGSPGEEAAADEEPGVTD
jgi:hypothetical protein